MDPLELNLKAAGSEIAWSYLFHARYPDIYIEAWTTRTGNIDEEDLKAQGIEFPNGFITIDSDKKLSDEILADMYTVFRSNNNKTLASICSEPAKIEPEESAPETMMTELLSGKSPEGKSSEKSPEDNWDFDL